MEFQAIIMAAGQGSRMTDVTSKVPKPLLPVGNRPLIWYPVKLLERSGFEGAIVVVLESQRNDIERALVDVNLSLTFATIPDSVDWGTADSLRHIKDYIKTDMMILSCDLITDLSLHLVADVHRTYDATVTMLLAPSPDLSETSIPGGKTNKKMIERDLVGLDSKGHHVLFVSSEADFDENVTFKKSLLKRHPRIRVRSKLLDGHLYLMKHSVLNYLVQEESTISTLKGELLPHLVRSQFTTKKQRTNESDLANPNTSVTTPNPASHLVPKSIHEEDELTLLAREYSTWNDHSGDMDACFHDDRIRCYAYVMDGGFCMRANTIATFCEANRQISKQISSIAPDLEKAHNVHKTVTKGQKAQIGGDSLIAEGTDIKDRTSIKKSVIGKHCQLGEKSKITNSILMNHVSVAEGSNLQGCIVCDQAVINEKCELKDCIVGNGQSVIAMGRFTAEVLVDLDRMMEI